MQNNLKKFVSNIDSNSDFDEGKTELRLECLESIEAMSEIKDEWQALEKSNKEAFAFFQTYNWCVEYHRQYSDDMSNKHCPLPQVFVLWHGSKAIMIWPLMRIKSRTNLKLLVSATEPLGQYTNILFEPSHFNAELGKSVFNAISNYYKVDCISINHYPKDSIVDQIIRDRGIHEKSNLASSMLVKETNMTWEEYYASLSKSQRKDRRRAHNKLSAEGNLSYAIHPAGSKAYNELVKWALVQKVEWLENSGRKGGILAEPRTKLMFQGLEEIQDQDKANAKTSQGAMAHCLYLDNKPVAVEIGMLYQNHYYSYLGAIDDDWKNYTPGKVQIQMAQQWAFENNIKTFDLLHDPSEYKSSWSNTKHDVISCNIPFTTKGKLYAMVWKQKVRPKLKSLYHFSDAKTRKKMFESFKILSKK